MKKLRKKGQEEMFGFVLIIVLIAVILLVFLGIVLRNRTGDQDSVQSYEISNFLEASLQHTSNCANNYEPNYYNLGELIINCQRGKSCSDDRAVCEVMEKELKAIVGSSWNIGEESQFKGYKLNIKTDSEVQILSWQKGNITNNFKGATSVLFGDQSILVQLQIYS
jgi:hypothetical protein